MKAAILDQYRQPLRIDDVADPQGGPGAVVVRIEASGVCRTDWHFWNGDWDWLGIRPPVPVILGHEYCGTVVEVGAGVSTLRVGDKVTVPFHEGCGRCPSCMSGYSNRCQKPDYPGGTHSGAFAEFIAVPNAEFNCVPVPESVDPAGAALLGCRYMTAYRAVMRAGAVEAGQSVLVLGVGGMGLAAAQLAMALGANVIAVDPNPAALGKAEEIGVPHVLDPEESDPTAIADLTGGGAHVAIDAICRQETVLTGIRAVRTGGTFVQAGLTTDDLRGSVSIPIDEVTAREISVKGSYGNPRSDYDQLLALVASGRVHPEALVGGRIDLADINTVIKQMTDYSHVGVTVIDSFGRDSQEAK